jgi:hypothetical protein
MDAVEVVQAGRTYLGVYHACSDGCRVRLATSSDLRRWTYRATLDRAASQPSLAADGDGFVLAVETAEDPHVRLWHFTDRRALLRATPDRRFDAPRSLSACAEGTPTISRVSAADVRLRIHYFAGCRTDREAVAELDGWRTWTAAPDPGLDARLTRAGAVGKHGDRDQVRWAGEDLIVLEAQTRADDWSSWRLFVADPTSATDPVRVVFRDAPHAAANPAVARIELPSGRTVLLVSVFVPREGAAAPGSAGESLREVPLD